MVVNKVDSAPKENIDKVLANVAEVNPRAQVVQATSPIMVEDPEIIRGKRVLVIEDGPTLTHGEMKYGAGTIAARLFGASESSIPVRTRLARSPRHM